MALRARAKDNQGQRNVAEGTGAVVLDDQGFLEGSVSENVEGTLGERELQLDELRCQIELQKVMLAALGIQVKTGGAQVSGEPGTRGSRRRAAEYSNDLRAVLARIP